MLVDPRTALSLVGNPAMSTRLSENSDSLQGTSQICLAKEIVSSNFRGDYLKGISN